MCGINCIVDKKNKLSNSLISLMAEGTRHRGPDETKTVQMLSANCTYHLAANRLKITDQSFVASQPMCSDDGKTAMLFNGEIYNFHELKNELLQKGIRFFSNSDTEVLFHWLRMYGREGVKRLEGMFAIIFVNLENDEVFVVRDKFGIKPLYYFHDNRCLIVSSEIKAIIGTGLVEKELDPQQVSHYLAYKYAQSPGTFFKQILEVLPGQTLIVRKDEIIHEIYTEPICAKEELENATIENLLCDSLLQQIEAQVPLGLLLSGGVDSTLLLALAQKEGFQMPTFSIVNSRDEQSFGTKDHAYAKLAAAQYGAIHHEVELNSSMLGNFEDFISTVDQPIGDSAYWMSSEICKYASSSVKVLLSGAGADELFGGYNRHRAFDHYLKNRKYYSMAAPILRPVIDLLPTGKAMPFRKKIKLIDKLLRSIAHNPENTFRHFITFDEFREGILPETETSTNDKLGWALQHDRKNYLVSDVLALSDKASMLHGVELRVPYLSGKLADYLARIPGEKLMKGGGKRPLKDLLIKYGGKKYAYRAKEGFGLPLGHWLMDKKANHLWDVFHTENSLIYQYVNKEKIDRLVGEHKRKAEDHGPLLWSVLVLAHWLELNAS
ncbi:MAG: asparagine synthase (glutamine-hydrolyzing) [Cyclobacteriaceae bacterium]|nr:asparagine synthase (glutamine-hydrolyzing) [Cyclobacteriaceae bacterium]